MAGGYVRLLAGLYGSLFLVRASFSMAVVLISHTYSYLSPFHYGLLVALNPLAELLTVPIAGIASDRYGHRPVFLTGLAIAAGSTIVRFLWADAFGLALLNILAGAAAALILVSSLALVADLAGRSTRGRQMGIFDFVTIFGIMLGFVAGFLLTELRDQRGTWGYVVAGVLAGIAWAFAWVYIRDPEQRAPSGEVGIRDLVRVAMKPRVALVTGPWLVIYIFIGAFSSFLERLASGAGFTGPQAALGIVLLAGVILVSQVGYGWLSDRYGRPPLMLLGAAGLHDQEGDRRHQHEEAGGAGEAIVLAARQYGVVLALSFLAMLAFAPAALAALADEAEEGPTGLTMSLYSIALSLGFILGPVTTPAAFEIGALLGVGGHWGLAVWIQFLALVLAVLVWLRYKHTLPRLPPVRLRRA